MRTVIVGLMLLCIGTRPFTIADGNSTQEEAVTPSVNRKSVNMALLAADLAQIAAKLADAAASSDASSRFRRARARRASVALQGKTDFGHINNGQVVGTSVDFKGHKLSVITLRNDEYVGKTVIGTKQPFQRQLLGILMDLITPGSTIVDAGANMGLFSVFFAAQTGPTGAVYSFEPQARMFQLVCTNMIVNSLMHMRPMNRALSFQPGVLQMSSTLPDGSNVGKSYKDMDTAGTTLNYGGMRLGAGGEEVQVITLDSLNLNNVSVIKVDIQGAEKLMFYGAQETIKRNMPVIAYEASESFWEKGVEKDLQVPDNVRQFDFKAFLTGLGYTEPPQYQPGEQDRVMIPPNHRMLANGGNRRRL